MRIPALRSIVAFVLSAVAAFFGLPFAYGAVLTVEKPVTMWDKVDQRLAGATPCAQILFRGFKSWCMQHLKGINLQLVDFADLAAAVNPLDGAMRVYAVYAKKQGTATDAFLKLFDDAATDTAGNARLTLGILEASRDALVFYPDGLALASGIVLGSYTAPIGAGGVTATTAGDGPNGFMLVG
jgi:hypothetical protein